MSKQKTNLVVAMLCGTILAACSSNVSSPSSPNHETLNVQSNNLSSVSSVAPTSYYSPSTQPSTSYSPSVQPSVAPTSYTNTNSANVSTGNSNNTSISQNSAYEPANTNDAASSSSGSSNSGSGNSSGSGGSSSSVLSSTTQDSSLNISIDTEPYTQNSYLKVELPAF